MKKAVSEDLLMNPRTNTPHTPDLSLVMPCYNEEAIVGFTIQKLLQAFSESGYRLELIAVNNGSSDRTGALISNLAERHSGIRVHTIERNQGYGWGVLSGMQLCTADWVGIVAADSQVDAEDVVRLFETAQMGGGPALVKVRRRFRMDGLARKVISIGFNAFIRLLWPGLASIDVNGTPKILPRHVMRAMKLRSKDWFLDAEMMVKAEHMGLRVMELNVFARLRGNGLSHVRVTTCWEFLRRLIEMRLSREWRTDVDPLTTPPPVTASALAAEPEVRR